jgi:hypothetical protein
MSHQRQSFQAKHINEGMFIEDLVMWRQWRHYNILLENAMLY